VGGCTIAGDRKDLCNAVITSLFCRVDTRETERLVWQPENTTLSSDY